MWKICEDHEYSKNSPVGRFSALLTGFLGTIYAVWLVYAAGLQYLLMAVVFIAIGIPVYIWACREDKDNKPSFTCREKLLAGGIVFLALIAIYAFAHGLIHL